MGRNNANVLRRINQKKKMEVSNFQASAITVVRWSIRLQSAGKMKQIKTRGPRIGRRKKTRK